MVVFRIDEMYRDHFGVKFSGPRRDVQRPFDRPLRKVDREHDLLNLVHKLPNENEDLKSVPQIICETAGCPMRRAQNAPMEWKQGGRMKTNRIQPYFLIFAAVASTSNAFGGSCTL